MNLTTSDLPTRGKRFIILRKIYTKIRNQEISTISDVKCQQQFFTVRSFTRPNEQCTNFWNNKKGIISGRFFNIQG